MSTYGSSLAHLRLQAQLDEARTALLLTDDQMARCHEMRQLGMLQTGGEAPADDEAVKPFRLAVKRRLSKRHREVRSHRSVSVCV